MNILAVDTTTKSASVSVKTENSLYIDKVENEVTHSEKLLPLIDKVLIDANIDISKITNFACINGPGSFTGIRIGLATVKALAQVKNLDIFSINSLELIAYLTFLKCNVNKANIISIISTNNDRVFYAVYELEKCENKIKISSLSPIENDFIDEAVSNLDSFYKTNSGAWGIGGNCVNRFEDLLLKFDCNKFDFYPDTNDCINVMDLVYDKNNYTFNAYSLKATYARPSQAERMKNG